MGFEKMKSRIMISILLLNLFLLSCSENNVKPTDSIDLNIVSLSPESNSMIEDNDTEFSVKFDKVIQPGNLSIRIFEYSTLKIVEKVNPLNIEISENTLSFQISSNLNNNTKYYILLDSGAITYSDKRIDYKGIIFKDKWTFTYSGNNLKVTSTIPANNSQINNFHSAFEIRFDNIISEANLSIRLIEYNTDVVIETIKKSNIILYNNFLRFSIDSELKTNTKYYVMIDSNSIKYSATAIPYIGFKTKDTWTFNTPAEFNLNNIISATISGQYNYIFSVEGAGVLFNEYPFQKVVLFGTTHPETKHQIVIHYSTINGSNGEYSLQTDDGLSSSYFVKMSEDYLTDSGGKINVIQNNDKYYEANFSFNGKVKGDTKTVSVKNGYIFFNKK